MALGIHALRIAVVVSTLYCVAGLIACGRTAKRAHQQAYASASRGTLTRAADGRACCGADDGADHRAINCATFLRLPGRCAGGFQGILPARCIIGTELIKIFA